MVAASPEFPDMEPEFGAAKRRAGKRPARRPILSPEMQAEAPRSDTSRDPQLASLEAHLGAAIASAPRRAISAQADSHDETPPDRTGDFGPMTMIVASEPVSYLSGPVEPPPLLPMQAYDTPTARARPMRVLSWKKRSRKTRFRAAAINAAAWLVTLIVVAATIAGGCIVVLGPRRTAEYAERAHHAALAATAALQHTISIITAR